MCALIEGYEEQLYIYIERQRFIIKHTFSIRRVSRLGVKSFISIRECVCVGFSRLDKWGARTQGGQHLEAWSTLKRGKVKASYERGDQGATRGDGKDQKAPHHGHY
jgi:hypothetical protein